MVSAHMDEVEFVVKYVEDSGYLRFEAIGSIDSRILLGQRVALLGEETHLGVIGAKSPHILPPEDTGKPTDIREIQSGGAQ
jgi:endoglucanase